MLTYADTLLGLLPPDPVLWIHEVRLFARGTSDAAEAGLSVPFQMMYLDYGQ